MKKWLVLLLIVMLGAFGAYAQDDGIIDLGGGYGVRIPDGWERDPFLDSPGSPALTTEQGSPTVLLFPPDEFTLVLRRSGNMSTPRAALGTFSAFFEQAVETVTEVEIDGRAVAYGDSLLSRFVVVTMSDGTFGGMIIIGRNDRQITQAVMDISAGYNTLEALENSAAASAEPPVKSATGGIRGATPAPATTDAAAAPCTVSTDTRDAARLRVGPGENRGAIAFLPVNTEVTVTGRIEEADGDVWYQLDKDEAMPGTSANEIWVSADEVDTEGDCAAVGEAAAPPVIPGGVVAPPNPGGSDGGGSGVITGGNVPVSGTWTVNENPTTNASCQGGGNVSFPTQELTGEPLSYRVFLSVRGDGSSFTDGDATFSRTAPGAYFGTRTFSDGTNGQVYLSASSARSMSGQIVGNFTIDNIPCSYTITISMRAG